MRELTAQTRIRVRAPLPLPRKRELTGDTKLRLSQIVDLKDLVLEMAQDEAAPEGAVHHWSDGDHIKKNGKWVPVQNQNEGKENTMASNGKANNISLTRAFFDKHYNGKIPKTDAEIKQFIKDAKAVEFDPRSEKYINRFTKRGLAELKEVTGASFKHVIFVKNPKVIAKDTIAQIVRGMPDVLMINPKNKYWRKPKARRKFVERNTSTKSIYHAFLHEVGHVKIRPKKTEWDDGDDIIALSTSLQAMIRPDEFCAEFYAKKKYLDRYPGADIKITEEEKKLFEKYGGSYDSL